MLGRKHEGIVSMHSNRFFISILSGTIEIYTRINVVLLFSLNKIEQPVWLDLCITTLYFHCFIIKGTMSLWIFWIIGLTFIVTIRHWNGFQVAFSHKNRTWVAREPTSSPPFAAALGNLFQFANRLGSVKWFRLEVIIALHNHKEVIAMGYLWNL